MKLRIATRKSPLALWQAEYIQKKLISFYPDLHIVLVPMSTSGDKVINSKLLPYGGKNLFVKELEEAILRDEADIAVHSMKDVPATLPNGLAIIAICERAEPFDAFIANDYTQFNALPAGAHVGTSSLRRQCQLRALRSDLIFEDLRGNVGTRLEKLDNHQFDAIILAEAGLKRLGLQHRIQSILSLDDCLPAVGQGALGIEARIDNKKICDVICVLNHTITYQCVMAERAFNQQLGGGCHMPVAAYADVKNDKLFLQGMVSTLDGSQIIRDAMDGAPNDCTTLGENLARHLLTQGAQAILQSINKQ